MTLCPNNPGYRKLCNMDCKICFDKSFASHTKAQLWSSKNPTTARGVFKTAGTDAIFNCGICTHEFKCRVADMKRNKGCKFCGHIKLCGCALCLPKSFASHPKAAHWVDAFHKPETEFLTSNIPRQFECEVCQHHFPCSPANVVGGSWCPYCASSGGTGKLCEDSDGDCKMCFEKSFASYEKAEYWLTQRNGCEAHEVRKSSNLKYWFRCRDCEHEFDASLDHISSGEWCPYCAIPSRKKCDEECKFCFQRSFASHEKARFWSSKNEKSARQVAKNSHDRYLFNCDIHQYEFGSMLFDISKNGSWCALCATPTEAKLFMELRKTYPNIAHQFRADWCKKDRHLPFDFVLEEQKIIIELDGPQHFRQISDWDSPEVNQANDLYKMKCANEQKYSVIRIIQEDVTSDTYPWLVELVGAIQKVVDEKVIQCIYMCKKDEYASFKQII